ncbi:MAG: hypothetical protein R3C19_11745 [Planctomycetaceae bacterium]
MPQDSWPRSLMNRVTHEFRRRLAMLLAKVRLHRVRVDKSGDGKVIAKRRSFVSPPLVAIGNRYLRLIGADSEVLRENEWLHWEAIVAPPPTLPHEAASRRSVSATYNGDTLAAILRSRNRPAPQKLEAVQLALQALLTLQQRRVMIDDEESWPLSHGDATADNVCIDLQNGCATWFDFDTRHRRHLPAHDRHADDLRALLFSSAALLPCTDFGSLTSLALSPHISDEVRSALHRRLHSDWRRPNTFHLAQAPLPHATCHAFRTTLLQTLGPSTVSRKS